jgi:DNA-binding LacI/PurR family transcriptional regulator/signal transduction histidine kinase
MSAPSGAGRPTIGVLVDWLENVYQNTVLAGVLAAAEEANANVVCFAGGVLRSPDVFGTRRNTVYALANRRTVDGLVILAGTVGNSVGPSELVRYCARFEGIPLASIGVPLPGIPSFLVDNAGAMQAALAHLIDVHHHRAIAFVRGPEVNEEAEQRFQVYRQALAERGIPFDPGLVAPGNFQGSAGADAVRRLLDERGRTFDALVAANDHMALGALKALSARGYRVPQQIALMGFDDTDDARLAAVPLATVRQPLWDQGHLAVQSVLGRLSGLPGSPDGGGAVLSAELVPRASCGCTGVHRSEPASARASSRAGLSRTSPGRPAFQPDPGRIFEALLRSASGSDAAGFFALVEQALQQTVRARADAQAWHEVISVLRAQAGVALAGEVRDRALDLLDEARVMVSDAAERVQGGERLRGEAWMRALRSAGEVIITSFETRTLTQAVASHLPSLGIRSCYLAAFEEGAGPEPNVDPTRARLLLAYNDADPRSPVSEPRSYATDAELVPADLFPGDRRTSFVVEPLFFEDVQLGFAVIEMGPRDGAIYEALRSQLSTALQGARLMAQILSEAERRKAEEREAFHLKKLEAVGRLAAGIAHEINTPIQYVRDSVQFVHDGFGDLVSVFNQHRAFRDDVAGDAAWRERAAGLVDAERAGDVEYLLENVAPALARSLEGLERVATIVRSMKEYAHPDSGQKAAADINRALETTLVIARNEYKYVADVSTAFGEIPPVVCHLGELNQAFLNILVNAAHAIGDVVGTTGSRGLITVRTWREGGCVAISIGDTGTGIPDAIRERIFDPFFTTKGVGKGTGQGLAIAHGVVVRKHGGSLTVETAPGKGTTFFIRIPIEEAPSQVE